MELDKLMESWNEEEHNFSHKEPTEIVDMLSQKSQSSMAKVRKNMLFEFLMNLIAIPAIIWYNIYLVEDKGLQGFNFIFLTAFACLTFVYAYKFGGLYKELRLTTGIKKSLKVITNKLEIAIEIYKSINYSILPFALIAGMMNAGNSNGDFSEKLQNWPIYTAMTVIVFIAMMFFIEYITKKMYGKHLKQLKENYNNLKNI